MTSIRRCEQKVFYPPQLEADSPWKRIYPFCIDKKQPAKNIEKS